MSTEANRKALDESIRDVRAGKNLISVEFDESGMLVPTDAD